MGLNLIYSIYQSYCERTRDSLYMQRAEEIKDSILQKVCSEEHITQEHFCALENAILDYRCASDAEKFAEGFKCALLLCIQCLLGDCYE